MDATKPYKFIGFGAMDQNMSGPVRMPRSARQAFKIRTCRFNVLKNMCFLGPARAPGTPKIRPEMGAPGPPDILGLC